MTTIFLNRAFPARKRLGCPMPKSFAGSPPTLPTSEKRFQGLNILSVRHLNHARIPWARLLASRFWSGSLLVWVS